MKANKFFAIALAALTLVGFSACKGGEDDPTPTTELSLDKTSLQLAPGATETITATVEATWTSSNINVATVAGNGKTAVVTAVANGNAVISATANGVTKTCVVLVKTGGGPSGSYEVKGSQIWPVIMDGSTLAANQSKMVVSFQPNDVDQFLYIWHPDGQPETVLVYDRATATGLNAAGNTEGYTALLCGSWGWAGAGFNIQSTAGIAAAEALRAGIVADPDKYFLHIAIKSTDNYSHCFYFLNNEGTKFVLGSKVVYEGPIYQNFTRDGEWQEFDIPLASYATALASKPIAADLNVFVCLTEGVAGAQLNLDEVYFYKQ